jgi:hypothetical protein
VPGYIGFEDTMAKITITFKTPDALEYAVSELTAEELGIVEKNAELIEEDFNNKREEIKKALEKWVSCGEYVTLVYDTKTDTIAVLKNR